MNDRLKELALQATTTLDLGAPVELFDKEKFAELIVKECADIAYKIVWDDLVHGYGQAVIPLHVHNSIKQHFGFESC